jgi:hypothetical protein
VLENNHLNEDGTHLKAHAENFALMWKNCSQGSDTGLLAKREAFITLVSLVTLHIFHSNDVKNVQVTDTGAYGYIG